jgi:flagellar basal-body rod protein FlgB
MNVLPSQTDLLVRLMDAAELRHGVISHNLANVNTPGYHRLEVVFDQVLRDSESTSKSGSSQARPIVQEEQGLEARADGNNVDIDREAVQLQKNSLGYQTYSQLLSAQLQMMRRAIEG